jgi:alkanesulfonate monooxygenase SsuD/methylene tetrahydromethanopterin reductase-like flavin-dependent oxidoreductase (luciferase family)
MATKTQEPMQEIGRTGDGMVIVEGGHQYSETALEAINARIETGGTEPDPDEGVERIISVGDMATIRDFLAASQDQEAKLLKKLTAYEQKHGEKLRELRGAYVSARNRTQRLFSRAFDGLA